MDEPTRFNAKDAYDLLVANAMADSLRAITSARGMAEGMAFAWESTVSFAEVLVPFAHEPFMREYDELCSLAVAGDRRVRQLWRECAREARRQGRLAKDPIPTEDLP